MNSPNKSVTLLFNPFVYIAGAKALFLGAAAIILASLIGSFSNTHFDGVLDTHTGAPAPLWFFLSEGVVDWLCLGLVLLLFGRLISRTSFRTIDLLGTQALARWPTLLISIVVIPPAFQRFTIAVVEQMRQGGKFQFNIADAIVFFSIAIGMFVFLCWTVVLMYKSFSVSCNVNGGKAIGTFIGGLLVAEIVSKLCLLPIMGYAIGGTLAAVPPSSAGIAGPPIEATSGQSSGDAVNNPAEDGARFVEFLAGRDYAAAVARFDDTMKRMMPLASLRSNWETLLNQAGPFQKQLGTRMEERAGYKIVFVTCQFERTALDLKVVFDAKKQVAGLFFVPSQKKFDAGKSKGS